MSEDLVAKLRAGTHSPFDVRLLAADEIERLRGEEWRANEWQLAAERCSDRLKAALARAEQAEARLAAVEQAGKLVHEAFEKGIFVRSTEGDADPAWAIKLFPYLRALALLDAPREGGE